MLGNLWYVFKLRMIGKRGMLILKQTLDSSGMYFFLSTPLVAQQSNLSLPKHPALTNQSDLIKDYKRTIYKATAHIRLYIWCSLSHMAGPDHIFMVLF